MTQGNFVKTTWLRAPNKVNGVTTNFTTGTVRNGRRWSGQDDPMWRVKLASGTAAVNPYSKTSFLETSTALEYVVTNYGQERYTSIFPGNSAVDIDSGLIWSQLSQDMQLNTELSIQMLKKIRKLREKFQGFVVLGEMRKTISFLRSPFKMITKRMIGFQNQMTRPLAQYRAYSKADRFAEAKRQRRRIRKDISDAYLEFTFGLSPLISDVTSIAEAVAELNQKPEITRIFGHRRKHKTTLYNDIVYGEYFTFWFRYRLAVQAYLKYAIGVRRAGADPILGRRLINVAGFNTAGLLPAAWELVPWSWLVDYVTNIGDIIDAMTVDTSDVLWSSRTYAFRRQCDLYSWSIRSGDLSRPHTIYVPPSYSGSRIAVTRESLLPVVGIGDFTSSLSFSVPSGRQVLNAALALSKSFFKG